MFIKEQTRLDSLNKNLKNISLGIEDACKQAMREPREVSLMAVTKYASVDDIRSLLSIDKVHIVGENKVQAVKARWIDGQLADIRKCVDLHLIGHLQTNKAKTAVEIFDSIDVIDSIKIAKAVNKYAAEFGKVMPVLIQIKISNAETQYGVSPEQTLELVSAMREMKNLDVYGYMAIAPAHEDSITIRQAFSVAAELFIRDFADVVRVQAKRPAVLSLGMSEDYKEAIMSGATMVRIGSALFKH